MVRNSHVAVWGKSLRAERAACAEPWKSWGELNMSEDSKEATTARTLSEGDEFWKLGAGE